MRKLQHYGFMGLQKDLPTFYGLFCVHNCFFCRRKEPGQGQWQHPPVCPTQRQWMQETKLVLEPPTPLSIPPVLTRVRPGSWLGKPKRGGLQRKRPGGSGSWPNEEKLPSGIWSPPWNITTWIKKLGPHLHTLSPSPLRPVTHFLLSYVTLKDQGRNYAIRGQIKKIGFSSLPPPQGCYAMCHIPSNEKLQSASRYEIFLGESTSGSMIHSSGCRVRHQVCGSNTLIRKDQFHFGKRPNQAVGKTIHNWSTISLPHLAPAWPRWVKTVEIRGQGR